MENKLSYWAAPSSYLEPTTKQDQKEKEEDIINKICLVYGVTLDELKGTSRKRDFVVPRQVIFYIFRSVLKYSLHDCGNLINRDHSTVVYSVNLVKDYMKYDNEFRVQVNKLVNYTRFYKSKEEECVKLKTSKFKGVSWKKSNQRWIATLYLEKGKQIHLGSFKNEHDAYLELKKAQKEYKLNK